MTEKPTPGPWRAEPYTPSKSTAPTSWCIYADNDAGGDPEDIIAEVYGREPMKENARLIAAAPDLLKYLIEFERHAWDGDPRHREADTLCQRARAAIKAATDE